jgi:ketosteroid isomerase-like protein
MMQSPAEREAIFTEIVAAISRGEALTIVRFFAEDVILELPGASPFAGVHEGIEEAARFTAGITRSVQPSGKSIRFVHEGDELIVSNSVLVKGEHATIEMSLGLRITFGPDGLIHRAVMEPSEPATFDWLVENVFGGAA